MKMTRDEYLCFLKNEVKMLTETLDKRLENGGAEPVSHVMLICERNRLVDKLSEMECRSAHVAFKVGDKIIGGSEN
jgi:hypothetical protein